MYGVDTQLLADGTYFVAEAGAEQGGCTAEAAAPTFTPIIVGCGGWSKRKTLYGGDQWTGREAALLAPQHDAAKIRAFFIHPSWTRRGIGTMILEACENAAVAAGFTRFEMGATLTGVLLYQARGYVALENLEVPLANGESLPIVRMEKRLVTSGFLTLDSTAALRASSRAPDEIPSRPRAPESAARISSARAASLAREG